MVARAGNGTPPLENPGGPDPRRPGPTGRHLLERAQEPGVGARGQPHDIGEGRPSVGQGRLAGRNRSRGAGHQPDPAPARGPRDASGTAPLSRDESIVAYRPVDVIEVLAWGATVGAVAHDPRTGCYAFEYEPSWVRRGIELSPLRMPL